MKNTIKAKELKIGDEIFYPIDEKFRKIQQIEKNVGDSLRKMVKIYWEDGENSPVLIEENMIFKLK